MNRIKNYQNTVAVTQNARYQGNPYETRVIHIDNVDTQGGVPLETANEYVLQRLGQLIDNESPHLYQVVYKMNTGEWVASFWGDNSFYPDESVYGLDLEDSLVEVMLVHRVQRPPDAGGYDKHNDCLYNCLKYAFADKHESILKKVNAERPSKFKTWVNVRRDDPIPVEKIRIIEDKLETRINVLANEVVLYHSRKDYNRTVNLNLVWVNGKGHYTLKQNPRMAKALKLYRNTNRIPVFYEIAGNIVKTYSGNEVKSHTDFDITQLKESKTHTFIQCPRNVAIDTAYDEFIANCEHLREITTPVSQKYPLLHTKAINLAEHDYDITSCSLSLFYDHSSIYEFDEIDEFESQWLLNTRNCGLMFHEECEGEMNCFDVNSQYPYCMKTNAFPICKGEFEIMESIPRNEKGKSFFPFGIFRAKVAGFNIKLFLYNKKHFYTGIDLNRALELGYSVELIQDGKYNAMKYPKRVAGKNLFGGYVDRLYKHKNVINPRTGKKNPLVKSLLQRIWGALNARDKQKIYAGDEPQEVLDPFTVNITPGYKNTYIISSKGKHKRPHGRIGVFMTAYGRRDISKRVEPIQDEVYRIHTDGFLTTFDDLETSTELGGLKLEMTGYYEVNGLNKIKKPM